MLKLLHAADLHLDSPFSGLSPAQAALRRAEQRALLTRLTEECNRRACDLLLLAGDLFDGAHVYRDTVDALADALRACRAQVLIAPGNHDWLSPGSPYLTAVWPENVHIFTEETISAVQFPSLGCRVYGAGFRREHCPALLEGFRAEQDGLINLMVLHGDATGGADYNPVSKQQIAHSGLRYLALGHIHKRGQLTEGGTLCAWPGCMMGRGFDETGEKGVYEVTIDGADCRTEFVPLGTRRYEILTVCVGDDPLAAVQAALPAQTERDIYRILLTGESADVDVAALTDALSPRFEALELRDQTVPPLSLWADAGEDTLKGQFLARMREHLAQAEGDERTALLFAVRAGLALFEGREVPPL